MTLQTQDLQNIHATKRTFADLAIGDTFDFINMSQPMMNSFYRRCVKVSSRKYQATEEPRTMYKVGSIGARVYHVADSGQADVHSEYIDTTWEVWSYDVWGNARDGYEVNDRSCDSREYHIRCKVEVNNPGTPQQFLSAYPSNSQIREALSLRRFKIDVEGDDLSIYVNRARDSYPCGELFCTSHKSLSPIHRA